MDPVIHFELPAEDQKRISQFYEAAFGWKTESLGPDMGNFTLAFTVESDANRIPKQRGAINGGFYKKTPEDHQVKFTILVQDIREAMKKIEAAGGKLLGKEPFELPGVGLFISFVDTEGNVGTVNQDFTVQHL